VGLSEHSEEVLEQLWELNEQAGDVPITIDQIAMHDATTLNELTDQNLITRTDENVTLTPQGLKAAETVIRRHRLAERLLVDVLDTGESAVEEAACRFEHVLREGIDENICILLGHPRVCPHGKPIPLGRCCQKGYGNTEKIVSPLSELKPNQRGRIAYLHAKSRRRLQKLMALGVTPGMPVTMLHTFPTHVFQVGHTQLAVDKDIANETSLGRVWARFILRRYLPASSRKRYPPDL
jgi:DtxR family Mn-dependent transcriptional regulator